MNWTIQRIEEIDVKTLYNIIALRVEVFIIEQNCFYQELDYKDFHAMHIYATDDHEQVVAYLRVLDAGVSYDEVSIGRVVVSPKFRGQNLGRELMLKGINHIKTQFGDVPIRISAQAYLIDFYKSLGFESVSEIYLEDDIPHVEMLL